jgi:GNAT superfamily N-acetyltransferase
MRIKYKAVTDFKNQKFEPWINWWSDQTKANDFTISLEPAEILNSMIIATFALWGEQVVGAAGLMPVYNEDNQRIRFKGRDVVEFRANCVDENFEKKGIGSKFIEMREDYAEEQNYLSVIITKQPKIVRIAEKNNSGWKVMEGIQEYEDIFAQLRKCDCHKNKDQPFIGSRCAVCPLYEKSILVRG